MAHEKYSNNFPLLAKGLAREGYTDDEIAKKLGISRSSYYSYQSKYSEFRDAINEGKAPVDIEIEDVLIKKARGYYYEEKHTEIEIVNGEPRPKTIKTIKKHVPPSDTALIFWLKNRKPGRWKDKQDIKHSGEIKQTHDLSNLTYEQLKDLAGRNQESGGN